MTVESWVSEVLTINVGVLSSGDPGSDPLTAVPFISIVSVPAPMSDFKESFPKSTEIEIKITSFLPVLRNTIPIKLLTLTVV